MASTEARITAPRSRRVDLALTIGVYFTLIAAALPLLRVVDSGAWVGQSLLMTAAVLATGYVARWFRLSGLWVSLLEIVVWLALATAMFGRGTAIFGVIPTPETFSLASVMFPSALEAVAIGAAPLEAAPALSFLLVGAIGLLAIVLDHVVLTARMPLLGAVGLVTVSLIPSIAVSSDIDLFAFALLGAGILFLLRVDTRGRQRSAAVVSGVPLRGAAGTATASATALGIGAIAVIVAIVAAPLLPAPTARAGGGSGGLGGTTIDASLELGDDLRQPGAVEVLQMRWTGSGAPYMRVTTLSQFDGSVWNPDEGRTVPLLGDAPDIERVEVDGDIAVNTERSTVDIVDLNARWAPVPYPAVDVTGLDGEWNLAPDNRTVIAQDGSVQDQAYEVVTETPDPTLEQIRSRDAGGAPDDDLLSLPEDIPDVIEETAAEITANAGSDYDALVALQSFFRGPTFGYSLDAPVADGFDGSGVDAVADFLEVREGYCVHFASAFAVMARALGMPSRIVVGYLPGTSTGLMTDGETVYSVSSTQLHAWPEVYFAGVGWIPFEPTNSLGTPTNFQSATTAPGGTSPTQPNGASGAATPTPTPTASGLRDNERDLDAGGVSASGDRGSGGPTLGLAVAALVLLLAPGVAGLVRRRRRFAAARRGDAASAWLAVQEFAVDLGIPVPAAETPRAFGARLAEQRGADASAMDTLVRAIERASYAGDASPAAGEALADAVAAARAGLLGSVSPARGLLARAFPRSLVVRPGSAYAGTLPPRAVRA